MSKERELLNRCAVTLKAIDICPLLLMEITELLNEPEQEPVACNAIPYEHSDTVSAFNPVSNNYWDR